MALVKKRAPQAFPTVVKTVVEMPVPILKVIELPKPVVVVSPAPVRRPLPRRAAPVATPAIVVTPEVIVVKVELPKPDTSTVKKPTGRKPIPRKFLEEPKEDNFSGNLTEGEVVVLETMNRRQRQIIVHSVIYYRMNDNIVDDKTWNIWARELVILQERYPKLLKKTVFYEDMKDFDASTGFHLADHPWGMHKAQQLLAYNKERKLKEEGN